MKNAVEALPATWYTDPTIYQVERETIFSKQWIYAAHDVELPNVGDYITVDIAGYSLMLIRQEGGEVGAFHNVCRHRASPLLTEEKGTLSGQTMSCKYHGWTYSHAGELVSAPYFDCSSSCDREQFSLFGAKAETFDGLIFVNLDAGAAPVKEVFSDLFGTIKSSTLKFKDYKFHSKMVREGNFNWKVWNEGYQECYHCPTIHPVFLKDFFLQKYKIENRELFAIHGCERKVESSSGSNEGLWLWVYPNLGLPVYEPAYYTLQVNPLSVDRTRLTYTFHFRDPENTAAINEFMSFVKQITQEDINVCEAVQKNMQSGIFRHGYLNPERENGVVYFHSLVRRAVQQPYLSDHAAEKTTSSRPTEMKTR